jgi:glucose-6-phosphate dehydrogenase assembly protein OpcA
MAAAVGDRLFQPSTPEAIEADLAALWRQLGQGATPIARAVMSNLIVFRNRVAPPDANVESVMAGLPLDDVVARHPCRLIVIEHERGAQAPDAPFAAGVGILTFGPERARYGIEQVVVRSACAEASLPSIVRHLARGDLPTSVWWTEDLSQMPPLEALVTMGRQLVYDSRGWRDVRGAVRVLEPLLRGDRIDLADVNWRRLIALRRALIHARPTGSGPLVAASARVHIAQRDDEAPLAWLLAGALMASKPRARSEPPQVEASGAIGDATLVVTVDDASGRATITLSAAGAQVVDDRAAAPLTVTMPIESAADAVAAELRMLSPDSELHAALAALVQRFAAR